MIFYAWKHQKANLFIYQVLMDLKSYIAMCWQQKAFFSQFGSQWKGSQERRKIIYSATIGSEKYVINQIKSFEAPIS